ncbi:MAG: hypothetical protein M1835_006882 [Candelina submexicana]|nr:MAG: hypothetical protein M1835_006882 [Candelina submexicana]
MAAKDVNNYTSSSPHRLPTVSASQALQSIGSLKSRTISTGLKTVDGILQGRYTSQQVQRHGKGGLPRGHVTEVYGPPGVGKTAFAMQVSANALHSGDQVIWVGMHVVNTGVIKEYAKLYATDAASSLVGPRFKEILLGFKLPDDREPPSSPPADRSMDDLLSKFNYFTAPTLPHVLALLFHPSPAFPPSDTAVIVIDSISTLFNNAFARTTEGKPRTGQPNFTKKPDAAQWAASRRWAVMEDCMSKLSKLAATKNIAVLLTSQTTTKVRAETGAVLHPALSGKGWDRGLTNRIVLFRDWPPSPVDNTQHPEDILALRYAGVVKAGGVLQSGLEGLGSVVPFVIESSRLKEIAPALRDTNTISMPIIPGPRKRKLDEIADSQSEDDALPSDEEYGWAEDDIAAEGLIKE